MPFIGRMGVDLVAVSGPAMSHGDVTRCLQVLDDAVGRQQAEKSQLEAQGAMATTNMQNAAAGTVTQGNYQAHMQQAEVLKRQLDALRQDIMATQRVFAAGEDEAESMARSAAPGSITTGMQG